MRGVTKRFGQRTVVDHVDLSVPRGSAFGYLGPNGAGKTTLMRMLLGLTAPSGGEMRLLGEPLPAGRGSALARVGAMIEEPRFLDVLSGRENLAILAAARNRAATARIDASLARVGLRDKADARVGGYSQGMRQRLGLAMCLLCDPELLILDEPTNGLDPAGILEFRGLVRGFVAEGKTVVLSSHLLSEVERMCDVAAIVAHGQVVAQGTIAELEGGQRTAIVVETDQPLQARAELGRLTVVQSIAPLGTGQLNVTLTPGVSEQAGAAVIARALVDAGLNVCGISARRATLEERYFQITQENGAIS